MTAGATDQAIREAQARLQRNPDDPTAHHQLGDALAFAGNLPAAATALRRAVELRPDYAPAWARLGNVLRQQGNADGAIDAFSHSASLVKDPAVLCNLGEALSFAGRLDESIKTLEAAIALEPGHPVFHLNLGTTLRLAGDIDRAIASFNQAIRLKPGFHQAHYNLAIALLLIGDYPRGWDEFEWRLQPPERDRTTRIFHRFPAWRGESLDGRTIFVHLEQGFGDAFQFARFIPLVAARGGRVLLECRPEIRGLLERLEGVDSIVEPSAQLPAFDVQIPLLSLPRVLGITLDNLPRAVPYLSAPPDRACEWMNKLPACNQGLRIGIAWSGSPTNTRNHLRSCPPEFLRPLAEVPGVILINLQKGAAPPEGVVDPPAPLADWTDTAALMTHLDLVITVDTGIAHLAGALGRPVWTMLSTAADWRYLRERTDSPWYPTMRLFRQRAPGDWPGVVREVETALRSFTRAHQRD